MSWIRVKAWLKHWWKALAGAGTALAGIALFLVLRPRTRPPTYNDPLELKQKELREAEALGAAKAEVERISAEIEEIEARRTAITDRQVGRIQKIDAAESLDDLARLRDEQNAALREAQNDVPHATSKKEGP